MLHEETIRLVQAQYEQMVADRRHFHAWPERSGEERETAAYIQKEMAKLGMTPVWTEGTAPSALYLLDTGKPGKTLVLRADMDALPMLEEAENLAGPKVCVSQRPGFCHACGHDAHVAMLLGAARVLAEKKAALQGKIWFLFESAEEKCSEEFYRPVLEALRKVQPDALWGVHVTAFMPTGTVSVQAGPRMSGHGPFHIRIHGKGGHGSRPDQAVNPVVTAAEIACKLQSVVPLQVSPFDAGVLTVSSVRGGEAWNVIPDTCDILGGLRYFTPEVYEKMNQRLHRIVEGVCLANDCRAEFLAEPVLRSAVNNDPALSALAERAVQKVCPGAVVDQEPWMASESFAWYQAEFGGVFAFVGMQNPELGSGALHHNGKFDVDEGCMTLGAMATVQFAADFLNE